MPLDLVALSLLGVLAIAVQRKAQAEPQPDWTEQLALWACPIGESGSRRSAVLARVAAPLLRYEAERRAREQLAADASESALRLAKDDLQRAERDKSRAAEALTKAEGTPSVSQAEREALQKALDGQRERVTQRLQDVRKAEAALVKPPRLLIEDATVEAAATVLAEQGERLGIVSAEGDFFENLGARFGKQVPVSFWAKTYTGDRHVVDRRGGGGADGTRPRTEVLERPCLSMVLSPQPVVLGELRDRRTLLLKKGIMARFVYAVPASRVGYRELHPEALPAGVEYPWHETVGRLLALEYAQGVGAVTGRGKGGGGRSSRTGCASTRRPRRRWTPSGPTSSAACGPGATWPSWASGPTSTSATSCASPRCSTSPASPSPPARPRRTAPSRRARPSPSSRPPSPRTPWPGRWPWPRTWPPTPGRRWGCSPPPARRRAPRCSRPGWRPTRAGRSPSATPTRAAGGTSTARTRWPTRWTSWRPTATCRTPPARSSGPGPAGGARSAGCC